MVWPVRLQFTPPRVWNEKRRGGTENRNLEQHMVRPRYQAAPPRDVDEIKHALTCALSRAGIN